MCPTNPQLEDSLSQPGAKSPPEPSLGTERWKPPKCLVPSADREWQALGKEGCTEVLKSLELGA